MYSQAAAKDYLSFQGNIKKRKITPRTEKCQSKKNIKEPN